MCILDKPAMLTVKHNINLSGPKNANKQVWRKILQSIGIILIRKQGWSATPADFVVGI